MIIGESKYIYKIKNGYVVQLQNRQNNKHLFSPERFFKWESGSMKAAFKEAQTFRNEQLIRLEGRRIHSLFWSEKYKHFIRGLGIDKKIFPYKLYAQYRHPKTLKMTRNHYKVKDDLRGCFLNVIANLEKNRRGEPYPQWVIDESWPLLEKRYNSLTNQYITNLR